MLTLVITVRMYWAALCAALDGHQHWAAKQRGRERPPPAVSFVAPRPTSGVVHAPKSREDSQSLTSVSVCAAVRLADRLVLNYPVTFVTPLMLVRCRSAVFQDLDVPIDRSRRDRRMQPRRVAWPRCKFRVELRRAESCRSRPP